MTADKQFEPMYPDVLGMIAPSSARISFEALQIAIGVFPRQAYLNQPFEVICLLQSMIDQPIQVRIGLQLPNKDPSGRAMQINAARKVVDVELRPGEVGVQRIPVVALSPTQPGENYPIQAAVRYRPARPGRVRRPLTGGPPASVLAVSPFKLQVLKDVDFASHPSGSSPENVTLHFDIAPRRMPNPPESLTPTYEMLWTVEQLAQEQELLAAKTEEARVIASLLTRMQIYQPVLFSVQKLYADNGLALHPGEAKAIAKMVTYTLDDGATLESVMPLEDTRWFQTLAQSLAANPEAAQWEPGEIVSRYLIEAALYDAILTGFSIIRPRVRVNLGDRHERINYARRVLTWLAGQGEADLAFIYLPLALGGVTVNAQVMGRDDDPWRLLDEIREAARGRQRLVSGATMEIFEMLDKLIERAEDDLRRARVRRES
jgi:hypothetical protein